MGHWGISKHFSPVHNVLGTGLPLLLAPPPLLVMMLYCINIARAAHTESQGRLDFEGWHSALQGRGCRRFSDCAALRGAEHITLVNALPSGSECGSVYAIKITFNCAFGIVEGCSAPPAQRRGLQRRRPPATAASHRKTQPAVSAGAVWIARCVMNDDRYGRQDIIETNANSGRLRILPAASPLIGRRSRVSPSGLPPPQ